MKFMCTWSIDQSEWMTVLSKFASMTAKERADAGKGVKIVGRWHDLAARQGVAILETSDVAALYRYLGQWNPVMDMDVAPVLDDEETAKAAKAILARHRG